LLATSGRAVATRLNNAAGLLLLLSAAHAVTHAFGGLMPLVFPMVADEFNLSYTNIGLLVGFTTFAGGMAQLIYPILSRHFLRKVILAGGQFIIGVSCLATGMAGSFTTLFLGNLGARLGSSPQHPMGNSLLSDRFPMSQRGSALSLHVVGGNIGTVAVPILGAVLLSTVGWRATLFILAVPAFLLTIALVAFIEEKREQPSVDRKPAAPTRVLLRQVLSTRTILFIMLASVVGAAGRGLGALNTYLPLYLNRNLGISTGTINVLYACLLIGGVIGPFLLGKLSDQAGRRIVLYLIYAGATVFMLVFVGIGAAAPLIIGAVLFVHGMFSHSDSVVLTTYLADVATPEQRDVAFSIFFTVAFGVGSLWPTVLGYIADHYGLVATFTTLAATYLAAGLCLLPIREKKATT
jgi:FSR family fosmidomycin resistance protein-like MFS transporter